ncbi:MULTISPECIES: hypothetical protein [Bacillus]|uniref:Uncharacterized protein n=1 Tax=Bacillus glycinifermentans TaxID=1664069 RepID=A0AAJ3Z064_9BACI|nr:MULTISPECIES: hypothetical protein [Bacillus]MDU0070017.1 hypothetical protein [Bacillus sp. IG6]MED8017690.1 hypothetical protein [Bacillus glycinifermentans]QAT66362.1 hypothetical protein EQZ20_16630 [Bacillus glycinifermentans]WKB76083.1 hypothetical protein QYM22_16960 [Bacillus glycinifermentans]
MAKVKKKLQLKSQKTEQLSREEIGAFKPTHIKFNFSFLTTNNKYSFSNPDFKDEYKAQLLTRIVELSSEDYHVISSLPKNRGLEFITGESFSKLVNFKPEFNNSDFRKKASDKYAVFRLYSNNNPIPGRIIGKIVNKIFYVFFIDLKHKIYKG